MARLTERQKEILKTHLPHKGMSHYYTGTVKRDTLFTGNAPMHFAQGKRSMVLKGTPIVLRETHGSMGKSVIAYLPNGVEVSDWEINVPLSGKKEHYADWEKHK